MVTGERHGIWRSGVVNRDVEIGPSVVPGSFSAGNKYNPKYPKKQAHRVCTEEDEDLAAAFKQVEGQRFKCYKRL
jgi:hypothetical protein